MKNFRTANKFHTAQQDFNCKLRSLKVVVHIVFYIVAKICYHMFGL